VTLGPMEIASAFRAPMLETGKAGEEPAGNLDQLLEQVGDRKVVYGFVDEEKDVPVGTTGGSGVATGGIQKRQSVRICMAEPARVRPVSRVYTNTTPPMSPRSPMSPTSPRWSGKI